ncbi:sperm microtubule associated protein 2-like [Chaetodon trifascialis]|uniref:sperm microtubule associated protein 2-like n=1 Tax=Chaetodon trifascialis TaxID=109706 RepID=UPI00399152AA
MGRVSSGVELVAKDSQLHSNSRRSAFGPDSVHQTGNEQRSRLIESIFLSFACLENIYSASAPTFSRWRLLIGNSIFSLISERLIWGNQEPVWPISSSALGAVPSARIQYLARHKRDFSAREDPRRKEEEEASFFRKTQRPSVQYEHIVRLSTPKTRRRSSQEAGPPHTPHCDTNCPIWHVEAKAKAAAITLRLLQLSTPKREHPDFQSSRESVTSVVSSASKTARASQRLVQLSLPKLKESNICWQLGRPEDPIWTVSKAARGATASARVEMLATPKQLSKDYVPSREPEWSRRSLSST